MMVEVEVEVEVELSEWEQHCCGEPFRVGSTVTWKLVARLPSEGSRSVTRYLEEHHDETPEHVPHLPVSGTVRFIQVLHYTLDAGLHRGESTVRPGLEVGAELEAVPGAGTLLPDHQVLGYRVQLEVAEEVALPADVPHGQDDWFDQS